jgi:hypothetical protein
MLVGASLTNASARHHRYHVYRVGAGTAAAAHFQNQFNKNTY